MVACKSCTWTLSSTTFQPNSSVEPCVYPGFDSASGHPQAEGARMMIAAQEFGSAARLVQRCPAKLASPDD